jgi:ureidoacrylate peracid hydrolase
MKPIPDELFACKIGQTDPFDRYPSVVVESCPMRPVLLVIDMQNGFCHPEGSYRRLGVDVKPYRAILPRVRDLINYFHKHRLPVYYTKAVREASGIDSLDRVHKILPASRKERIKMVPICIRGTWDAEVLPELTPMPSDLIVEKRRDSAFQDTEMDLWLRALSIDTLVFTGIDTFICVESTLRDAFNRGYDVLLAEDAVASIRPDWHRATLTGVKDVFGLVLPSARIMAFLDGHLPKSKGRRKKR